MVLSNTLQESSSTPKPPDSSKPSAEGSSKGATSPSQRVLLLAQLSYEAEHDSNFAEELTKIAGDAVTQTAQALARSIRSDQTVLSKLIQRTPDGTPRVSLLPVYPTLEQYLEQHPDSLPMLPPILDPAIEKQVFSHAANVDAWNLLKSYERLEYLGDSYIEIIARRLAYQYFPDWMEGRLSTLCQELVRNETLSRFSFAYGFDDRLKLPHNFMDSQSKDFRQKFSKMFGDVFEAYAAAVVLTDPANGFHVLERWMTCLWKPILLKHQHKVPYDPDAKLKLTNKIAGKGIKIEYVDEGRKPFRGGTIYSVGVYLTGWGWQKEHLGSGKGESKKEAGMWAATEALTNPATPVISAVKKEFDAKVAAEREKEGGPDPQRIEMLEKAFKGFQY